MITTQPLVDCYQILVNYNEDDDKEEGHDDNTTSTLTSTPLIKLQTLELDKALVHLSHLDTEYTEHYSLQAIQPYILYSMLGTHTLKQ